MKKFIAALLLVALLATSVAALANVQFKNSAYLYKKAGSGKTKIIIRKGSVLDGTYNSKKTWTAVKLDGKTYYVRTKYLKSTSHEVNPVFSAGGTGHSTQVSTPYSISKTTFKALAKINLRKGPSLSDKIVCTVKKGAKLKGLGKAAEDSRGQTWYYVQYGSKKGWVSEGKVDDFD